MKLTIPNCITLFRMAGTLGLLALRPVTAGFYALYTLCGLSDVLDGWLARRLHQTSASGARLDSAADLLFYTVMILKLLPVLYVRLPEAFWYVLGVVVLLRLVVYAVVAVKFRCFAAPHTWLNKLTGLMVFGLAYSLWTPAVVGYCWSICAVAAVSAICELRRYLLSHEYPQYRTEKNV